MDYQYKRPERKKYDFQVEYSKGRSICTDTFSSTHFVHEFVTDEISMFVLFDDNVPIFSIPLDSLRACKRVKDQVDTKCKIVKLRKVGK